MSRLSLVVAGLGFFPEVAHAYGDGYSTQGYDCASGYSNWRDGWADGKKAWCCQQRGLGCPNVNYPDSYPGSFPSEYQDVHPEYAPAPTIMDGSYHQDHYVVHRQNNYVEHYNEPVDHVHVHYDYHRTARNEPYNCETNYANWEGEWPASKKAWCCEYYQRGCVRFQHDQYSVHYQRGEYYNDDGRQYYNKVEERSGAVAQQSAEQSRVFGVTPIFGVVGGMTLALIALAVRSRRTLQRRLPYEELLTDMTAVE